jgi:peptide/nickel transport system ATP-binding protein
MSMYLGSVEIGTAEQVYGSPQHPYTADSRRNRSRCATDLAGDMPSAVSAPAVIGPAYPEREICSTSSPSLKETGAGQKAACHFAGTPLQIRTGR